MEDHGSQLLLHKQASALNPRKSRLEFLEKHD